MNGCEKAVAGSEAVECVLYVLLKIALRRQQNGSDVSADDAAGDHVGRIMETENHPRQSNQAAEGDEQPGEFRVVGCNNHRESHCVHRMPGREAVLIERCRSESNIRANRTRSGTARDLFDDFVEDQVYDADFGHAPGCRDTALTVKQRQREYQRIPNPTVAEPADEDKKFINFGRTGYAI